MSRRSEGPRVAAAITAAGMGFEFASALLATISSSSVADYFPRLFASRFGAVCAVDRRVGLESCRGLDRALGVDTRERGRLVCPAHGVLEESRTGHGGLQWHRAGRSLGPGPRWIRGPSDRAAGREAGRWGGGDPEIGRRG